MTRRRALTVGVQGIGGLAAAGVALPAIACYYTTDAPNRSTNGPTQQRDYARVMLKNRR